MPGRAQVEWRFSRTASSAAAAAVDSPEDIYGSPGTPRPAETAAAAEPAAGQMSFIDSVLDEAYTKNEDPSWAMFQAIDKDGDGVLLQHEVEELCGLLEIQHDANYISDLMRTFDPVGTGVQYQVWDPTAWAITRHDGPNHLGL